MGLKKLKIVIVNNFLDIWLIPFLPQRGSKILFWFLVMMYGMKTSIILSGEN